MQSSLFYGEQDAEEEDFFELPLKQKKSKKVWKYMAVIILCFGITLFVYHLFAHTHFKIVVFRKWLFHWNENVSDHPYENNYIEHIDAFERFMKRYERNYGSDAEVLNRLRAYTQHMNKAEQLNLANAAKSARFGETIFADWTDEEFKKILMQEDVMESLRKKTTKTKKQQFQHEAQIILRKEDIPDYFDWRPYNVVTPVKSQFKCGSCWAFATVATVESAYAIGNADLRSLSEQQLLDCDLVDDACNGGHVNTALEYVYENGLMSEYDYPYVAHRQDTCYLHGSTTRIKSAVFLHPDEDSIIDWLLHFGLVNVVINATADIKQYTGGVYTPNKWECENKKIGLHALNIVGYGTWNETDEKYWIIKNSWGQTFGIQHGYMYFARGINSCGIEQEPMGVLA